MTAITIQCKADRLMAGDSIELSLGFAQIACTVTRVNVGGADSPRGGCQLREDATGRLFMISGDTIVFVTRDLERQAGRR